MKTNPKSRARAALLILPFLLAAACNTTAGMGEDIQSAGSELEKAAENND